MSLRAGSGPWGGVDALITAAILVGSGLFFRLTLTATLELSDEGMIIYPTWLTARGVLPYQDYFHVYGPSLFFFNGALLARFGADLLVIRWPLLLCKSLLAAAVYLLSRQVASRVAAFLVTALMVAIWGTPVWVFNSPYANHYALPLSMLALLAICALPPRSRLRFGVAGLAIGLAATFKQTLGLFYAIAVVCWIMGSWDEDPNAPPADAPSRSRSRLGPVTSVSVLIASAGVYLGYASANLRSWSTLCLLAPAIAGAAVCAAAATKGGRGGRDQWRTLQAILLFGAACALPLAAYAAFYSSRGMLGALVFNTVSGLPQQIDWFEALPVPPWRSVALGFAMVSSLIAVRAWYLRGTQAPPGAAAIACTLVALATGAMVAWKPLTTGVTAYFAGEWTREMAYVVWWLPVLAVYASFVPVFADRGIVAGHGGRLRLFWLFAAAAILQLYPAADLPHAVMILPACLPLLAHFIDRSRLVRAPAARSPFGATLLTALVTIMTLGVVAPCLQMVRTYLTSRPPAFNALQRAGGTWAIGDRFADAAALIEKLPSFAPVPDGGLFVIANEQLLYVLAGVDSPLPAYEFVFYLVQADLISGEEARALIDESMMIERLEQTRPLIIDHTASPAGDRFRRAFPRLAHYLTQRYREAGRAGGYVLWQWTAREPAD
jgi:hypothetical protein